MDGELITCVHWIIGVEELSSQSSIFCLVLFSVGYLPLYKYYHDILLPHRSLFRLIMGNMICRDLVIGTRKLKFVI